MLRRTYPSCEPLTGLDGSSPIGFLAACGLLRLLSGGPDGRASYALSWRQRVGWEARIHGPSGTDRARILARVKEYVRNRGIAPSLGCDVARDRRHAEWGHDINGPVDGYRELVIRSRRSAGQTGRGETDLLAAYGSDGVVYERVGKVEDDSGEDQEVPYVAIEPTPWYMVSGQQSMLKTIRDIITALNRSPDAALEEALYGPWRRGDKPHSLGLDPARTAVAALCGDSPPAEDKQRSTMAAVWLAFEAFPLFPCAPVGQRLLCPGWDDRGRSWSWPLWEHPLPISTIRLLLSHPALATDEPDARELESTGVSAVYRSVKEACGQDRYNLTPGRRVG